MGMTTNLTATMTLDYDETVFLLISSDDQRVDANETVGQVMTRNRGSEDWSSNDEPAILNGSWYDENDYFTFNTSAMIPPLFV